MTVDLVARIQAGDVDAFETLYQQHSARIYTLASRMAGSPEDGEDLLQEIFLQAYRKIGGFMGAWLGGWLYDRYQSYDMLWWASIATGPSIPR